MKFRWLFLVGVPSAFRASPRLGMASTASGSRSGGSRPAVSAASIAASRATLALAAADVTLARAGASTLGEFPVARLPALLTPHPGVNQLQNAEYLVAHGGAVLVMDQLLRQELKSRLLDLLQDQAQRQRMEARLAELAQPEAAGQIAATLYELSNQGE